MCVVTIVRENEIGIGLALQRLEPGLDGLSLLRKETVPESQYLNLCARRLREEIGCRSLGLALSLSNAAEDAPMDFQADAAREHAEQRRANTDLDVVRMGTKTQNRHAVTGAGKLQGLHDVTLSVTSRCRDATALYLVPSSLRVPACL